MRLVQKGDVHVICRWAWVSFAEYRLFYRALLQKRPIIWRRDEAKALCLVRYASHHRLHLWDDLTMSSLHFISQALSSHLIDEVYDDLHISQVTMPSLHLRLYSHLIDQVISDETRAKRRPLNCFYGGGQQPAVTDDYGWLRLAGSLNF